MIKERILQIIETKGVTKEKFFKEIGMTSANFRGKALKTPLNSTAIENIFAIYPDISAEWLLTGEGNIFKDDNNTALAIPATEDDIKTIPFYDGLAVGGM